MTCTPSIGILKKEWHEDCQWSAFPFPDEQVNMNPYETQPPKLHILVTVGDPLGTHWGPTRHRDMECPVGCPEGGRRWTNPRGPEPSGHPTPDGPMSRTVWNWNLDSFVDKTMYSLCRFTMQIFTWYVYNRL